VRLVLLRHAEAEGFAPTDVERTLTPRGRTAASDVGRWLAREAVPDLAVVSPATRARETWDLAAARLPSPPEVRVDERVYANSVPDLLAVISAADVGTLVVVGHNPSIGDLAHELDEEAGLGRGYPTAAVSVFEVDGTAGRLLAYSFGP
jgi:phosphohistidine phosphatase